MVAIHNHSTRNRRRTTDRIIVAGAVLALTALVMVGAGYVWDLALSRPIAADRVAYGEVAVAVLALGLLALYPFVGILTDLVRNKRR